MEVCTNLNDAKVGQYVKVGTSRNGAMRVKPIAKVWKNGRIDMGGHKDMYVPDRDGRAAYPAGRRSGYFSSVSMIWPFAEGETVEGVQEQMAREEQERREAAALQDAAKEAAVQAKIAEARISFRAGADIPGSGLARWTDSRGNARITLYFPKHEQMYGTQGWHVNIANFEDGSFGSSYATSTVSPEDAVSRWIAAWW